MDASSIQAVGRETANTGEVLSSIGDQMIKAQALQEHTEASNKAEAAKNDLVFRAKNDPDYKNSQKYIDELSKIKSEASKGLTLRASKSQFESDFGSLSNSALMDIKQDSRKKMVSKGISDLGQALEQNQNSFIQEGNPTKQNQIIKRMNSLIDSHVQRGYLSPEDGQNNKKRMIENLGIKKFTHDLSSINTPEAADGIMEALRSGDYEQNGAVIDPKDKESMYKDAERYKTKYEKEQKKALVDSTNSNQASVTSAMANKQKINTAGLDETAVGKNFINLVKLAETTDFTNDQKVIQGATDSLLTQYAKISSTQELIDFRNQVLVDKSQLDEPSFRNLLSWTDPKFIQEQVEPKKGWIQSGLDLIKNAFSKNKKMSDESGKASLEFMQKALDPGTPPEEVLSKAKETVSETAMKTNPKRSQYELNQIVNIRGNAYKVIGFDDDGEPLIEKSKGSS